MSSGDADDGSIVIEELGTSKAVVVPEMEPTVTTTIFAPGVSDPPVGAAGISVVAVNEPVLSVKKPPEGIPLEPPKVITTPVVLGGKLLPVTVTIVPVEAAAGSTVTVPAGTVSLACATLVPVASVFKLDALSVAVTVYDVTAAVRGTVIVPVPDPSEPTGKARMPARIRPPLIVTVNVELVEFSRLSTVIPVTVTVTDSPAEAVDGVRVRVRAVLLNPLDFPTKVPLSVAVTV
jgi:hypothetical protein